MQKQAFHSRQVPRVCSLNLGCAHRTQLRSLHRHQQCRTTWCMPACLHILLIAAQLTGKARMLATKRLATGPKAVRLQLVQRAGNRLQH